MADNNGAESRPVTIAYIAESAGVSVPTVSKVAQLSEAERDQLRAKGIPFVVFDPTTELPDDVPFVGATNWAGGRAATRHLAQLGHRRIAMIGGSDQILCCRARLDGYRAALEAAGLPADPALVVRAALTREDGYAAAAALLARPDRPSAVFAANDLHVAWVDPPMTTVHQPLTQMAAAATELALAIGRGEAVPQVGLEIATTLTVRASTAPPKT